MISNVKDLYATIAGLEEELRVAREEEWSRALHAAMYVSGIAGEVLGEIRARLLELRRTDVPRRLGLKDRIEDAIAYINELLGPPQG